MLKQIQKVNGLKLLKVLITRPEAKNKALALLLKHQGINSVSQPLFNYQANAHEVEIKKTLCNADIIIFVSTAAVEFSHASFPLENCQHQQIIAVGKATKKALQILNIKNVLSPEQENSEGVLLLSLLNKSLTGKNITIVRGNGGREHLAKQLRSRGAIVQYLESYQRIWATLAEDIDKQWQEMKINCIVITSNEILESIIHALHLNKIKSSDKSHNSYWINTCIWLVASKRIADNAIKQGLQNVINCHGANDQVILNSLIEIQNDH